MQPVSSQTTPIARVLSIACDGPIQRRSLRVALVVGTVLNVINRGSEILAFEASPLKFVLTFCVPYLVATYGAVMARPDETRSLADG